MTSVPSGSNSSAPSKLAAVYARKSNDDTAGIRAQWNLAIEKAGDEGYTVPGHLLFADNDVSGETYNRPGLDALKLLIQSGDAPFDRVYVRSVKRLFRRDDPRDRFVFEKEIEQHGVTLRYCKGTNVDLRKGVTPETVPLAFMSFLESVESSRETTELKWRTETGKRARVKDGFYPSPQAPYGTERWLADASGRFLKKVEPGEGINRSGCAYRLRWATDGSAEVVQEIFEVLDERGLSYRQIARLLNERGVPRPRGGRWHGKTISKLVSNPIYKGDLIWGRTVSEGVDPVPAHEASVDADDGRPILYTNFMPSSLVSRERWASVQKIAERRRNGRWARGPKALYPLSKLLRCELCGGAWNGHTSADGRRRSYRHSARVDCPDRERSYLRASKLEEAVEKSLFDHLDEDKLQHLIMRGLSLLQEAGSTSDRQERITELERGIERRRTALDRLERERAHEELPEIRKSKERVIAELAAEIENTRDALARLKQSSERASSLEGRRDSIVGLLNDKLSTYRHGSSETRREILHQLIRRILVNPNDGTLLVETRPL